MAFVPDPFCKDCKHHSIRPNSVGLSRKPNRSDYVCDTVFDPITGEQQNWSCVNTRGDQMQCGMIGKRFEPMVPPATVGVVVSC